jgi:hypothetical protein
VESFGLGGEAARDSRVQWVWRDQHNRFHQAWDSLAEYMPDTPVKQYRTTIFGLTGYIPRQGIDFCGPDPRVVDLTRQQRELLRGQVRIGQNGVRVRRFLLDYVLSGGVPTVEPWHIDRFLWHASRPNTNPQRLEKFANALLRDTIDPTVTPGLRQIYDYTRRREMLRPGVPAALGQLIKDEIVAAFHHPRQLVKTLAGRLAVFRGVAVPTLV